MSRYLRQEKYIGEKAQQMLKKSKVAIIGLGALGSNAAELLARAGIGSLILYDFDKIHLQNLQRQSLFSEKDINKNKARVAKLALKKINSDITVFSKTTKLNEKNIKVEADLILDCTDNKKIKSLLNKYCKENKIPLIHASVAGSKGHVLVITEKSACYECLFSEKSDFLNAQTAGILNSIVSIISSIQANETIKLLTNKKSEKDLIYINLETNSFLKIKLKKNKNCKVCK